MSSTFDRLIGRVSDERLRTELRTAVAELRRVIDYGLVFERHLPETVRLPQHAIRPGVRVAFRDAKDDSVYAVTEVRGSTTTMHRVRHPDGSALSAADVAAVPDEKVKTSTVIAIAEFGEPIYPGLTSVGSAGRGVDRPAHVVINGENHHVLEALRFTHAAKIDCIYIDPPYNSGERDWKYNNNYVDAEDDYRHSKWLAFMERRLLLARDLLNPEASVLICAIDEKEYLRLGLLLEQLFPQATVQMVTTVVKPEGTGRTNEFSRTNEFLFFVMIGASTIIPTPDNMFDRDGSAGSLEVEWRNLRRREKTSKRGSRPNQFYAVFVDEHTGRIDSVGDPLADDVPGASVASPPGTRAIFPLTPKGAEMIWGCVPQTLRELVQDGYARSNGDTIQFLNTGVINGIISGSIEVVGRDDQGAVIAVYANDAKVLMPKTVWVRDAHNTQVSGTLLLKKYLPRRDFPSPKSLYAVEDALRFFIGNNPEAIVLDFFGGSGTTAHAVFRLNRQDGGHRQSITVTNNEVSEAESRQLRTHGYSPGDPEWEQMGIFEHITKPRVIAAVSGNTPEGTAIQDSYRYTDPFPMSDGFEEVVEFFQLAYLDVDQIELDQAFAGIAPLLWLRAGGRGRMIRERCDSRGRLRPYSWTDLYGVLFNTDAWSAFVAALPSSATTAYVVTDSNTDFAFVAGKLPGHIDVVRLYERYLATFAINT